MRAGLRREKRFCQLNNCECRCVKRQKWGRLTVSAMKKLLCLAAGVSVLTGCITSTTNTRGLSLHANEPSAQNAQAVEVMKADVWAGKIEEWTSSTWRPARHNHGLGFFDDPERVWLDIEFLEFETTWPRTPRTVTGLVKSQPEANHSSLSQVHISAPRSQADFVNILQKSKPANQGDRPAP